MSFNLHTKEKTTVALGFFDGVHIGHAQLIRKTLEISEKTHTIPIVYTFLNHPMSIYAKENKPRLILTNEERFFAIKALGISNIVADNFNENLCNTPPLDFILALKERLNFNTVVAGFNYTFGKRGAGNTEKLLEIGREYGFAVERIAPVIYMGETVSSTRIRNAIENGAIEIANNMLTSPYRIAGRVIPNRQVGRRLGFPTANIVDIGDKVVPKFGVYATRVYVDGDVYLGVTNVGNNPTFGNQPFSIETYIIDFNENIYDKGITVEFHEWLREQRKFEDINELKTQIAIDKAQAIKALCR